MDIYDVRNPPHNREVQTSGYGTPANGTCVELGDGRNNCTVITFTTFTQAVTNAALAFGKKIYDFPTGHIKVNRALMKITQACPTITVVGELALGTVVASGVAATTGGTATFEDIIDGTVNTVTSSSGAQTLINKTTEADVPDGHTTACDLYLNVAGTWTAAEDMTISGTVTIYWSFMGT